MWTQAHRSLLEVVLPSVSCILSHNLYVVNRNLNEV